MPLCHDVGMRIYLPSTPAALCTAIRSGLPLCGEGSIGYGPTTFFREEVGVDDREELEYLAMIEAAQAAVRALAANEERSPCPPRRVVIAADVADDDLVVTPEVHPAAVRTRVPILQDAVAAIHVDEADTVPLVERAVRSLRDPQRPDDELLDELADRPLLWYDRSELDTFCATVGP